MPLPDIQQLRDVSSSYASLLEETQLVFSSNLKHLRKVTGVTMRGLARLSGISHPTVWSIETQKRFPNGHTCILIAAVFGITPIWLVERHEGVEYV